MKSKIISIDGKEKASIELPDCFSQRIRDDLVSRIFEAKKSTQPYSPSLVAGKQHAAKGKLVHRRHVWRSGYGRGASRVPRKVMSRRGSQFGWVAAEIPFARGGMRAHPPKVISHVKRARINKKEMKLALMSALSATADAKQMTNRYKSLENAKIENLPLIIETKITSLKTGDLISSLKNILGEQLFSIALKSKKVRSGKGRRRGRKYKSNAGALIVVGKEEKMKSSAFDSRKTKDISITDLANGGMGRLTVYTEQAIKDLGEKFK